MSTGQIVGGIVGAVVGYVASGFNPAGALYGTQLGIAAGSMLDPPKGPTVSGPRLSDLSTQVSTYGLGVPRFYGTIATSGNIGWLEKNKLKETVKKKKSGGKGGGSTTTIKTYSYSGTFLLFLGEGPIAGVRRIWCGDKLIYNAGSADLETIISSNQASAGFKIYLGTDNQLPDSRYEADVGVGNAPAYRGVAYIAFYDFKLADYSNTLQAAQFKVEVVKNGGPIEGITFHSTYSIPLSASPANGTFGNVSSSGMLQSDGGSYFQVGDLYTTGHSDGRIFSAFGINVAGIDSYNVDMEAVTQINPIPGQGAAGDFAIGGATQIVINGGVYTVENQGQPHYALNTRYLRSGDLVYIWNTVDPDLYRFSGPDNINLRTSISPTGGVDVTLNSSGNILLLMNNGQIQQIDGTSLAVLSTTSFGLPTTNWTILGSSIRTDENGTIWIVHTTTTPISTLYKLNSTGIAFQATLPFVWSSQNHSWAVRFGVLSVLFGTTGVVNNYLISAFASNPTPLADIIEAEADLSALLDSADIDTSALIAGVRGYRVMGGTIRAAIEPLQGGFPFDVVPSGYQIKCVPRGQASVLTIPWEDLGANEGAAGDILTESREMDSQLPARVNIKYLDSAREYAVSEQYAERLNTEAVNKEERDLPLVVNATEAAKISDVLLFLRWLERNEFSFSLPPTYLSLETGDVVTVTLPTASHELRLTEINYEGDGRLSCKARPNRASLYSSNAQGAEGVAPAGTIGLLGPSTYALMDIPVIDEGLQNAPGFSLAMTGYTSGWPGGILYRSSDNSQTWSDVQAIEGKCTFGFAEAAIPSRSGSLLDRGSSLIVNLISGTLESISESAMLNGANYAAYGANGRWEILRFANAVLNGDGSYTLSVFWRGDRGSEKYTGTHQTGDTFVLLDDPDNAFIGASTALIGSPQNYRGITAGASIDSDTDTAFAYAGVNLECYPGVHPKGVRDTSLNLTISWKRRTRVGGEWRDSVDASLGETSESYEVDILNGSTVVRTITSTTPSISYTATQQTTDFGSTQASVLVRIYQLSSVVGRGYPLEATL